MLLKGRAVQIVAVFSVGGGCVLRLETRAGVTLRALPLSSRAMRTLVNAWVATYG